MGRPEGKHTVTTAAQGLDGPQCYNQLVFTSSSLPLFHNFSSNIYLFIFPQLNPFITGGDNQNGGLYTFILVCQF
jgi:hypothetical protein